MRFDWNPVPKRVIFIGLLIFVEALLLNTLIILQQGRFSSSVEGATILCVALLQLTTYFLGFLRRGEEG